MPIPEISVAEYGSLPTDIFRELDYQSIEKYNIPVELLMENAGLNLARLTASFISRSHKVLIGIGTGNNGGGGLVAARRLAGWGYQVFLHIPEDNLKQLPELQLKRALAVGVVNDSIQNPDLFIDAYLGFSQRLPLSSKLHQTIKETNALQCKKISLDIPTGFNRSTEASLFHPDVILTLAAMKTELIPLLGQTQIYIADLGLPAAIYKEFAVMLPPEFTESGILKCKA